MSPKPPSLSLSEVMKKQQKKLSDGVFGDVYGATTMLLPKDLDLEKPIFEKPIFAPFELRLQPPDFGRAFGWSIGLGLLCLTAKRIVKQVGKLTLVAPVDPIDFFRTREVAEFLSGALAGAMTKAVLAPLETIRTRMVVGVGSKNISGSFLEVIEQQGWTGLWAGNAINMLRIIPTQAIELSTFECVKRTMTSAQEKWKQGDGPKLQIGKFSLDLPLSWISPVAMAGAAAGVSGTIVCHPLEVLKDRLTVSPEAYPSLSIAISKIYKDGGIGGFYAGLSPTLIGMLPYSTCYYFMYYTMKKSYCQSKYKESLNRPEMLVIGALAGLTASTISFPLEVARKRLMVGALQGKCPPHMAAALSEVVRDQGLLGLYRGWGASCLKVMPSSGITWMFYEAWKDILLFQRHPL